MKRKIKELVGRLFWLGFCQSGGAGKLHLLENIIEHQLEGMIRNQVRTLFDLERSEIVAELERRERVKREVTERGTEILNRVVREMTEERK